MSTPSRTTQVAALAPLRRRRDLTAALLGLIASGVLYMGWTLLASSPPPPEARAPAPGPAPVVAPDHARIQGSLEVEARTERAFLPVETPGEIHVAVTVRAPDDVGQTTPEAPAHVALVIDRSGSMSGDRLRQARAAARALVDALRDGDRITVVAYDDSASVLVAGVTLNAGSRVEVSKSIGEIYLGGGTCISCGLEAAETALAEASQDGFTRRVVLLSDGKPDRGPQALGPLLSIARRLERAGATTSTLGLGLDYNERVMTGIAINGNGNHYFVEDLTQLAASLTTELAELRRLAARQVEVSFALPDGVRFVEGYDRAFERRGHIVQVSLGDIPVGAERTILMRLSVAPGAPGVRALSGLSVRYEDLTETPRPGVFEQSLQVSLSTDPTQLATPADHQVAARVEQARINETVIQINAEIERGNLHHARDLLRLQVERSSARNFEWKSPMLDVSINNLDVMDEQLQAPASASFEGRQRMLKDNASMYRIMMY